MRLGGTKIDATTIRMLQTGTLGAETLGKVVFALIMELKANGSLREATPGMHRPDTKETKMTANQVQTEEQRINEIKRKAEKAHTLCTTSRNAEGEAHFYKIESIDGDRINVSYYDVYNQECQDVFYLDEIEPEDKFFELTEIK